MRLGNILAGSAFRLALIFLPLFLLVLLAAGAYIVRVTSDSIYTELRAQISEELILFRDIRLQEGTEALNDAVDALNRTSVPDQRLIGLFQPDGTLIAGNVDALPPFQGWGTISLPTHAGPGMTTFYGTTRHLGGVTIFISRATKYLTNTEAALVRTLIAAGIAVVATVLAIAVIISRQSQTKLDRVAGIFDRVASGDLAVRLPKGRGTDQIDRISSRINEHLDRLSILVEGTRNTIIAIAHDLKSPLNRASVALQQATSPSKAAGEREHYLAEVQDELANLSAVFDTILRISRIEASQDRSGFTHFLASALVRDVVETYQPVIEDAGQRLELTAEAPETAEIFADRRMLMQMMANLIENASRYAGDKALITVSVSAGLDGYVTIGVADTGPGIPEEKREDVLRSFHRLSPGGHDGGAGLGLALVNAIANRHRAHLALADNRPGLRVTVTFPPPPLA